MPSANLPGRQRANQRRGRGRRASASLEQR